jgi:elongation factor Ts
MYLAESAVEQGILDKEAEIALAQAQADPKMAGKPQQVLDNVVKGRVRKFLEDTVLLNQAYVRDPAKTVGQLVKETNGASIVRFVRFRVGETYTQVAGVNDTEGGHTNGSSAQ